MGFSPLQWGRQGWHFIHAVALGYSNTPTEEEKKAASDFINSLTIILPCIHCATNFKEKIEKYPPRLDNSKDFFEWTVDIHNEVNKIITECKQKAQNLLQTHEKELQIITDLLMKHETVFGDMIYQALGIKAPIEFSLAQ